MKLFLLALAAALPLQAQTSNPSIDIDGYLRVAHSAAEHREARRVSEDDFIRMSGEPNTVVLDARSARKFAQLHVANAINLSFPDITADSLARVIPDKGTRVLIYCNNNFTHDERDFPTKAPSAALNISTYIALYNYGYRNVYELGPLLDVRTTKIPLVTARTPPASTD